MRRRIKFGVIMPAEWMREYKKLGNYIKPFKDVRKRFPYEIRIVVSLDGNQKRRIYVSEKLKTNGYHEPEDEFLKQPDEPIPEHDDNEEFPKNAPVLRSDRIHHIANGTYASITRKCSISPIR